MSRNDLEEHDSNVRPLKAPVLLLRVEEAAASLGIARTSMYQLVSSGAIRSVRVGRLRRIPVASLEEYVADLCTKAAS